MGWFDNLMPSRIKTEKKSKTIPDGLWSQCSACNATNYTPDLEKNSYVCPKCNHHMRINAVQRLALLFDEGETVKIGNNIKSVDFLKFKDSKRYKDRIAQTNKSTGKNEAVLAMQGNIFGKPVTAAAFEFSYMGGSMGSVVGERFTRAVEHAIENKTPFICFSASGGARMQEGLTSLMQMAKTSAALTKLSKEKLPFISVLTDPTMGGVSASFAMLGDLILAEPNALIGFAGPRVIETTVREKLPEGFQRSEFLLEKGAIDEIMDRREMREKLSHLLSLLMKQASFEADDATKADESNDTPPDSEDAQSSEADSSGKKAKTDDANS